MKKQFFNLLGFVSYSIFNDKTIVKNGTLILPNKANKVTLTADADNAELAVVAGKKYTYNIDDLIAMGEGNWIDSPETEEPNMETVVAKTPEQIAADEAAAAEEARKSKHKDLKAELAKKSAALLAAMAGTDKAAIDKAGEEYRAANETFVNFEAENKPSFTPEQQATIDEFEALKAERDELRGIAEKHNESMKTLKEKLPTGYKPASTASGAGSGESVPQRAPKLNYGIAQNIRADVGHNAMKPSEAAKKYGVTVAAINYITTYEHYKLKTGDTDFMIPAVEAPAQS